MTSVTTQDDIVKGAALLAEGRLVAFPTETVYGLGADARDEAAVARVFQVKGRPSNNPLIVHVATVSDIERYCDISRSWDPTVVRSRLRKLSTLWPGPLSVILPRGKEIATNVCAGGDTVAIRIPRHPVALKLLELFGGPIAAPSANQSMYVSPTTAQHVRDSLKDTIDLIIDGGPCAVGIESTVLSLLHSTPRILRPGAVTSETLSDVLGCSVQSPNNLKPSEPEELLSPGMLAKHYAPHTPVRLKTSISQHEGLPPRVGALIFSDWNPLFPVTQSKILSPNGDLEETAAHLFGALRDLDAADLDLIVVDTCEPIGLGEAIMDRLIRASRR
jgi:L-threonylcarbamoyladenylate synthase